MTASTELPDFGSRDEAVRCQTYSPVRKLDGLPHELFALYWRDVHGPLCARLPGLGFYVQHHFSRERRANLWPRPLGIRNIDVALDGAVEIGFANAEDEAKFIEASPLLFGDEINVFGWDAAFRLPKGSRTFVDRQADGVPNGPDKLHRLHVYLHCDDIESLRQCATTYANLLANQPSVQKLRLHTPEPFDNANPLPPSPVDHHVIDDMISLAVMEIGFADALQAKRFFDTDAFKSAQQYVSEHIQALAAFLVTGVYTYVRDGKPTAAGLRGSRTAEIIDEIGAANHLEPAVTDLFLRAR